MKKEDLLAIAKEAAKNIKTEHDLSQLTKMLSIIHTLSPHYFKRAYSELP